MKDPQEVCQTKRNCDVFVHTASSHEKSPTKALRRDVQSACNPNKHDVLRCVAF